METDARIPLQVQPPQIKDPGAVLANIYQLRAMQNQEALAPGRQQMQQQQIQAGDLENQQRQRALDAERAISESMRENISQGPDGTPSIDYSGVARSLTAKGHGAHVPGILSSSLKVQEEQAKVLAAKLKNAEDTLSQAGQVIQGIKAAPDPRAAYQQALPTIYKAADTLSIPRQGIPVEYDPNFVDQAHAWTTKEADHAREVHEAADMAQRLAMGLPKTAEDYQKSYDSDIATARNQAELDQKNAKWEGLTNHDKTGLGSRLLGGIVVKQWTPELPGLALQGAIPAEHRGKAELESAENASRKLAAAARISRGAYAKEFYSLPPDQQNLYAHPDDWDPKQTALLAAEVGTAPGTQVTAAATKEYRDRVLKNQETRTRIIQERAQKETATSDRIAAQQIANQAYASAGGDPVQALEGLKTSTDPEVQKHMGTAAALINQWHTGGLRPEQVQGQIDKAKQDEALVNAIIGGSPPKTAAPPAAAPKTSQGKIIVYDGHGGSQEFADESQAKNFETLVKAAGGTTSRKPPAR